MHLRWIFRRKMVLAMGLMMFSMASAAAAADILLDTTIDMVCFPPQLGNPPPCIVPAGIDPSLVSPSPSGQLRLVVFEDDFTFAKIRLEGIAPNLLLTAWIVFFPPNVPPPDPIFAPAGPGLPPIAGNSIPLAPTYARFSDGLSRDPNVLRVRGNGKARLTTWLDYNPLLPNQAPLRNGTSVDQGLLPAGTDGEQPPCCGGTGMPTNQPIASAYLRRFDLTTGFQKLGADGFPELLRSPIPGATIAIVAHIDGSTHGLNPGIPIPPIPGIPVTAGDHYVVGLFPIAGLLSP